ncbi:hypothetical protein OFN25_33145, partial [Escherichia coli]|nr:hypothetical protein [Escherichia coli]
EVQRTVKINWLTQRSDAFEIIHRAVTSGQCICWIRNTVDDALEIFQTLIQQGQIPENDIL